MKRSRTRITCRAADWIAAALVIGTAGPWAHAAAPPAAAEAPGSAAAAAAGPAFDLADPERIAAGKKRFGANCAAYCHGSEGEGGKTPPFKGRPDFSAAATYKVIAEGRRGADIMPPWGGSLSPEKIWELVAYLQFLSSQPASR